ncbi:MAG TPA: molybdate ABC transporter substrate-binding protein [Gammaproteobacteria bacterium]
MRISRLAVLAVTVVATSAAVAESASVAVAANFLNTMSALIEDFGNEHEIKLISGSTGGLYAQIVNGAPYDIFVAADSERPRLLGESGLGVADTRFTIARGRLVLWSAVRELSGSTDFRSLFSDDIRHLAIANPELAPYGVAARQTLVGLGLWEAFATRLVHGTSVAQAYALAATGNAELGLVAEAQVLGADAPGTFVRVPERLYEPIDQDAILLKRGAGNAAATELFEFLSSEQAKARIRAAGYGVPD